VLPGILSVRLARTPRSSDLIWRAATLPPVRVDQVIPSLASRDAIGVHTLAIANALREAGLASDIFYGDCSPDLLKAARPVGALGRASKDRWLLYQCSIGSPVFDVFAARAEPKLVNYHNITPADLLQSWEPGVGYEVGLGREQLARIARQCHLAIADSAFNEGELREAGFESTAVASLLIDMTVRSEADPARLRRLLAAKADGGPDFLFVGKVSPHKAPHDLVKMLAVYRRLYHPQARLHLVGSPLGRRYGPALDAFVADLGLTEAVSVVGSVRPEELEAYYRTADVFVCASDHEGFCVPIVEAMAHDVPVVAYAAAAVPETVGEAGLLLDSKDPLAFAAAVHRVMDDDHLRRVFSRAAAGRVEMYSLARARTRFVELVVGAVGS
jgi:glycosyltransferase involved in cell wall biosynthesis